jgi:hypothetical protein
MKCVECGHETRGGSHTQEIHVGNVRVNAVVLADICPECGHHNMTLGELATIGLKAAIVVFREAPDKADGSALKFARKSMGLMQKQLAALLGMKPETLCRYEKLTRPLPKPITLAIEAFLIRVTRYGESSLVPGWSAPDDEDENFRIAV